MTPLSRLAVGEALDVLLGVHHHTDVLDGLGVDEVLSLAVLCSLDALAGDIARPVTGLEVVTVDEAASARL